MNNLNISGSNDHIQAMQEVGNYIVNGVTVDSVKSHEWGTIHWKLVDSDNRYTPDAITKAFEQLQNEGFMKSLLLLKNHRIAVSEETSIGQAVSAIKLLSSYGIKKDNTFYSNGDITWFLSDFFKLYSHSEIQEAYKRIDDSANAKHEQYDMGSLMNAFRLGLDPTNEAKKLALSQLCIPFHANSHTNQLRQGLIDIGGTLQYLELDEKSVIETMSVIAANVQPSHLNLAPFTPKVRVNSLYSTVIIGHGNGGCYEQFAPLAHFYLQRGFNVVMFNHRGTANSVGSPSENAYYKDIEGVYQAIKHTVNIPDNQMIWHGTSLGGACAVEMGRQHSDINLVLDHTFDSIKATGLKILSQAPVLGNVLSILGESNLARLTNGLTMFDSVSKIKDCQGHILAIRAKDDTLIPETSAKNLIKAAVNAKTKVSFVSPGGHCYPWYSHDEASGRKLEDFLVNSGLASKIN